MTELTVKPTGRIGRVCLGLSLLALLLGAFLASPTFSRDTFGDAMPWTLLGLVLLVVVVTLLVTSLALACCPSYAAKRLRLTAEGLEVTGLAFGRIPCSRRRFRRTAVSDIGVVTDEKERALVVWTNGFEAQTVLTGLDFTEANRVCDTFAPVLQPAAIREEDFAYFYIRWRPPGVTETRDGFTYRERRFWNPMSQRAWGVLVVVQFVGLQIVCAVQKRWFMASAGALAVWAGLVAVCALVFLARMVWGRLARYELTMAEGKGTCVRRVGPFVRRVGFTYTRETEVNPSPHCTAVWVANGAVREASDLTVLFKGLPPAFYAWAVAWMRLRAAEADGAAEKTLSESEGARP